MEISLLGCRVSLGMSFLRVRFVTIAVIEEAVVNLEAVGSRQRA